MDEAIEASAKAQKEFMNHSLADRQRYVEGIREVVNDKQNLEIMSRRTVEESGMGKYVLGATYVTSQDGKTEGHPTEQQAAGMQRMYQILQMAGKTTDNFDDYFLK